MTARETLGRASTPEGGRIEVSLRAVDGHAELRAPDTGIGIAPEFLPHVFERFSQADTGAARRHDGLGHGDSGGRYYRL